jgi:hypothetical protein
MEQVTTQNLTSTRRLVSHDDALAAESRLFLGSSRYPRQLSIAPGIDSIEHLSGAGA